MKYSVLTALKQRISGRFSHFYTNCYTIGEKNYFTNIYGLARSIIALGTLMTLTFNDMDYLFARHLFDINLTSSFLDDINLFFLFGFEKIWIAKTVSCLILMSVISGYLPRLTGVLHWWVTMSFLNSATIIDGGDQIGVVMTLFLIPITLMDNRINHWKNSQSNSIYKNFIAFCVFLFIQLQVAIIYFQSGVEKPYKVVEWLDGTAIYYWFNNNAFGGPDWLMFFFNSLFDSPIVLSTLNWGVIIFEISLFGCFFMSKKKKLKWLKYAIGFHFMILIVHGLASFFFAVSGALILYLVPKNYTLRELFEHSILKFIFVKFQKENQ